MKNKKDVKNLDRVRKLLNEYKNMTDDEIAELGREESITIELLCWALGEDFEYKNMRPKSDPEFPTGTGLIARERIRQMTEEGYTDEHDDEYIGGEMALAASSYLDTAHTAILRDDASQYHRLPPFPWPWNTDWYKPSDDPIRNLEKAGALIAAEIDRLLRLKKKESDE